MSDAPLTRRELRELERKRERGEEVGATPVMETVSVEEPADQAPLPAVSAPVTPTPTAPAPVTPAAEPEVAPQDAVLPPQLAGDSGVALRAPIHAEAPTDMPGESFNRSPASAEQAAQEDGGGDYFRRLVMASHSTDETPTGMIVMPALSSPELTGALSQEGDIMVTGRMKVSSELSNFGTLTTGLDSPELDRSDDDEQVTIVKEHTPVSASRAVREPGMPLAPKQGRGVGVSIWAVGGGIAAAAVGIGVVITGIVQGWF